MAQQEINIGIEGNDGTGDSIRESFRKVNENFQELYSIFGIGGQINLIDLGDTPDTYVGNENRIPLVKPNGTGIEFVELASNFDLDGTDNSIEFDFSVAGKIIAKIASTKINLDFKPSLGSPLNANQHAIANVRLDQGAIDDFNLVHGTSYEIDQFVINKEFADRNYQNKQVLGTGLRLADEPVNVLDYTKTVSTISQNNLVITGHGFNSTANGGAYIWNSDGTDPVNLTTGNLYYLRVIDSDTVALYNTVDDALNDNNKVAASGGSGNFSIVDAGYNPDLTGNWLGDVPVPRKSAVRRQGDTMEGTLFLNDHPGDLAGNGNVNGLDDLQAVTKLYVDNLSSSSQINLYVSNNGNDNQRDTPFGKQGRNQSYAFKTINAACKKAEELLLAADYQIGPYVQTLTYDEGTQDSDILEFTIDPFTPNRENVRELYKLNQEWITAEVVAFLNDQYTETEFNQSVFQEIVAYMTSSVSLDVLSGNTANYLTRWSAIRLYSNRYASETLGNRDIITLAAVDRAKVIFTSVLQNLAFTDPRQTEFSQVIDTNLNPDSGAVSVAEVRFEEIKQIINQGVTSVSEVDGNRNHTILVNNGGFGNTDQGKPGSADIFSGKLIRGKTSGALAKIVDYVADYETGKDLIEIQLYEPVDFLAGENIEYGNTVRDDQITIRVESGTYYEDYPIRIPENVSIKGDEFRRVLVKPKKRVSQSSYSDLYFYRDLEFDGLTGDNTSVTGYAEKTIPSTGFPYYNPLTNEVQGYFGFHYLQDPTKPRYVGPEYVVPNLGDWHIAEEIINDNRSNLISSVYNYASTTYTTAFTSVYSLSDFSKDLNLILAAYENDIVLGKNENVTEIQSQIFTLGITAGIQNILQDLVTKLSSEINTLLNESSVSPFAASWISSKTYFRKDRVTYLGSTYECVRQNSDTAFNSNNWIRITNPVETISNFEQTVNAIFDANYNPPLNNTDMDVFMMNNATILRNLTVQGHGGFMCVLDPYGQILTKSPYIQTGSSFSQSLNRQSFRGGMFIDGFTANTPIRVTERVNDFRLIVSSEPNQGLFLKRPATPCSFYIDGRRFQVNEITNYDSQQGTAELILDISSNDGTGFSGITSQLDTQVDLDPDNGNLYSTPLDVTLQTAGNKSMLGNDFTQINDQGYGLVCTNGALSEMVSMFTYYCRASYYSKNGSQIRSLTGSSCYGEYGLVAEGSDPNEIPDPIILKQDMVQSAKTFSAQAVLTLAGPVSVNQGDVISQSSSGASATVEVYTTTNTLYVNNITGTFDLTGELNNDTSGVPLGAQSIPVDINVVNFTNPEEQLSLYVYDFKDTPSNQSEITVYHSDRLVNAVYEITNVEKTALVVDSFSSINNRIPATLVSGSGTGAEFTVFKKTTGYQVQVDQPGSGYTVGDQFRVNGDYLGGNTPANDLVFNVIETTGSGITQVILDPSSGSTFYEPTTPSYDGTVYKLNFTADSRQSGSNGLIGTLGWNSDVDYRRNQVHVLGDIESTQDLNVRPSTAIVFDENPEQVYRSISFNLTDDLGNPLANDEVNAGFDSNYDYIRMRVDSLKAQETVLSGTGTTKGWTVGDNVIAIQASLDDNEISRLNNNKRVDPVAFENEAPIFTWGGKKHYVFNYRTVDENDQIVEPKTTEVYAIVDILDTGDDVNYPVSGTGLAKTLNRNSSVVDLRAGLAAGETGTITQRISTCRVTGHDFLDVGTGGFNSSNYPNAIYGIPASEPKQENEVVELGKGRVFYVSTDQDGVFRVGRFFSVDQGTGTVSFNASIALSDIDGLGFKRGVVVSEFSTDSAMSDNAVDTVPTESAVKGYVDRRIGFDIGGNPVSNRLGVGLLAADGSTPLDGDINMASNRITNLVDGINDSDAVTKKYVDDRAAFYDSLTKLVDTDINNQQNSEILVYDSTNSIWKNTTISGGVSATYNDSTGELELTVANNQLSVNQENLNLNAATTRNSATGITQADLGVSSFDSAKFTATDGWISIADNAITLQNLQQIANKTVIGRSLSGAGIAAEIPFGTVVDSGGGVLHTDITGTNLGVVQRTATETYNVVGVTISGEADKIVKTNSNGSIHAESLILGASDTYEVLSIDTTDLVVKNPDQNEILRVGTSQEVKVSADVNVGNMSITKSTIQNLTNYDNWLSSDWMYTRFIEAPDEGQSSSTGISIGANTGKTSTGEIAIVVGGSGSTEGTSLIPFVFNKDGVLPDTNDAYDIGSATQRYKTMYASVFDGIATEATYADLAENYLGDADYEPGTVVIFGGTQEVTVTDIKNNHRVAGIVTTNPAHLMNSHLQGDHVVGLALQGRVPCKVIGKVEKGDMLVTSAVPGFAIVNNTPSPGTIIGKAINTKQDMGKGTVEVAVGKH